jgi:hypothetical protein
MSKRQYFTSEFERSISEKELRRAGPETQLDVMRTWFYQNFEDPAERTPYEGGYIWIWGGPHDALEELIEEFGGIVPGDVIKVLSAELNEICVEWSPAEKPSDYDEYFIDDIAQITEYYHNFSGSILDIEKMLKTDIDGSVEHCFYRLLFVNVITSMETYLSDAFINTVVPDIELMRRFVESTPEFKAEKISLADVYKAAESIEQRAKKYLADVAWHNIGRIKPMYKDVLEIEFASDIKDLMKAILIRHDIVHRNGKTKNGEEILITKKDVTNLISKIEAFIQEVDQNLSEKRSKKEESGEPEIDPDSF